MPDISIIIPTRNRSALLKKALQSLSSQRMPPEISIELVVVDNGSSDSTASVVAAFAKNTSFPVRMVIEPHVGLNYARNRGIKEAKSEIICFGDDDLVTGGEWIEGWIEAAFSIFKPDCVVGPVEPDFEITPPNYITQRVLASVTSSYSLRGAHAKVLAGSDASQIRGCNFAVKKSVAIETGGFDERLDRMGSGLLAGGEWEFGERLVRAGKKIVYEPRCRVQHFISAEKLSRSHLRARWRGFGKTRKRMMEIKGIKFRFRDKVHIARHLVFHVAGWIWLLARGRIQDAFEKELLVWQDVGMI